MRTVTPGFLAWIAVIPLVAGAPAFAQQAPDAGRLLEQIRPMPTLPPVKAPKIEREERAGSVVPEGPHIAVARLRITGATRFSEAELHALVADAEGKALNLAEFNNVADRITRHYRSHGYLLARAYLPAQDVQDGSVEIAVLEGRLGKVDVRNAGVVGGAALAPLSVLGRGDVARDRTLERSLLLLSDLPGVEIRSTLKPGTTIGTSDLLVDVAPGRGLAGSIDLDSYGDRFSGQYRLGGTANVNNPLRLGDQISLRAVGSDEGMRYFRVSYQLPVSRHGIRAGLAWSDMRYALGKNLAELGAEGQAHTAGLYLSQPLVRSRTANVMAQLQLDHVRLVDRINSTRTMIDRTVHNWTAGLSGDAIDGVAGGGASGWSVAYTVGHLDLDATTNAIDAATAQSAGRFGKLALSLSRLQHLTETTSLALSANGQTASKNLDSSQKFSLGGGNGVRAYPQGEAPGDQGYLLTLEVRRNLALPGACQLVTFVDHGHVTVNKNPWSAGTNSRTLAGVGLGLNLSPGEWLVKASMAWKLRSEQPISDADRVPRVWAQAARYF